MENGSIAVILSINVRSVLFFASGPQVLAELLAPGAPILVDGIGTFALEDLLPRPFGLA